VKGSSTVSGADGGVDVIDVGVSKDERDRLHVGPKNIRAKIVTNILGKMIRFETQLVRYILLEVGVKISSRHC